MTLRHGFTTGTAAAAAAKAAVLHLLSGSPQGEVDVPLPPGGRMAVPIRESRATAEGVLAAVVKDGGDDPDATHKAVIRAMVRRRPAWAW
jgi:cobalt-precorrin-5B (C1)-methyltransferase